MDIYQVDECRWWGVDGFQLPHGLSSGQARITLKLDN